MSRTPSTATRSRRRSTGRSTSRRRRCCSTTSAACADEYGIREHIRFRTEVLSATFDEERCAWSLQLRTPSGGEETLEAQAVISAVGQLNRPNMPEIAGMESFEGPSFHSARWDHDIDLKGKRVAVIGTGASADPVRAGDRAEGRASSTSSSGRRRGSCPSRTTTTTCRRACAGSSSTCRTTCTGTASGSSGRRPKACCRLRPSTRAGPTAHAPSARRTTSCAMLLTAWLQAQYADRPDLLEKVLPTVPAGVEAHRARQRRLGGGAEARQRPPDHRADRRRSRRAAS